MSHLFSPINIRGVQLKNRIVVSPMCQYSSVDGFASDWHLVNLGTRAVGGAALVFTEAAAVTPEGRISPADLGLWKDEHIEMLKRISAFIESQGSVPGIQLAHAGRKASKTPPWAGDSYIKAENGGWKTVAPSSIPFTEEDEAPRELTTEEIKQIIQDFKTATVRALKAGFKVIEIHGAHGYLLHEFLSPLSNKRTDNYGGSLENRMRFLLEIIKVVRATIPDDMPLFVRLSASDWHPEGITIQDTIKIAAALKPLGVDVIDCSSGGNVKNAKIEVGPGYQVPFAEKIKNGAQIMTGAVGLITTSHQANDIIEKGQADLIFMARELLRDPYFPLRAASELQVDVKWPVQYERAKRRR